MVEIVHWHILKFIVLSSQPTVFSACLENPCSFFHVNAFQKQAWAEVLWLWLFMSRLVAMPKFCPKDWLYNKKTGIQHIDHQPASGTPFSILHYCRPKCGALHFATAVIPVVAHQSQHPNQWCCTTILSSSLTTLKITTSGVRNFSMASWIFVANLTS